jgi:hypothetical protein
MATVPKATTTVQDTAGAVASGTDTICVLAPSKTNADAMPRLFGKASAIMSMHGYSEGVEYAAFHAAEAAKPILYVALPIASEGTVGRVDKSGNTGSSVASIAAGVGGVLSEHEGAVRVKTGGTVGTDQITLEYTLDAWRSFKTVKLGTATSYAIPHVNVTLSLTVGTLVAGETIVEWFGSAPKCDADGLADAFDNLAAQLKGFRSVLLIGDVMNSTEAQAFLDKIKEYETAHERFIYGRAALKDRLPYAEMSHDIARMTAGTALTFAEVGGTGDTITRGSGSWIAEGFAIGDTLTITGTSGNNISAVIDDLTATVITLDTEDLAAEVTSNATVVGRPTLTFAEVGASGDTITRNRGSWVADGFRAGDVLAVTGTASNNVTAAPVTTVTPLVLTLGAAPAGDLAAEVVSTEDVAVTAGQLKAAWAASLESAFESIDGEFRIDLGMGRGRKASPLTSWNFRRNVAWAASLREYQHDLHIPTWRKSDGNTGWSLDDADGNLVEWDDRVDGGAGSAARFTTFRTWGNGPGGAFITQSLTREQDGSLLSQTHNVAVVNLACTVCQLNTENFIGRVLTLNDDGTATSDSLSTLESEVNAALELALLTNRGEGARASLAVWTASKDDVLNVPNALLTGVCRLNLNGTIHDVDTRVRVLSGGQA